MKVKDKMRTGLESKILHNTSESSDNNESAIKTSVQHIADAKEIEDDVNNIQRASQSLDFADIDILNEQNKKLEDVIKMTRESRQMQQLQIRELTMSHNREIQKLNKELKSYRQMVFDLRKTDNYETLLEYQEQLTSQRLKSKNLQQTIKKQKTLIKNQQNVIDQQKSYIKKMRTVQKQNYGDLLKQLETSNDLCKQQTKDKQILKETTNNCQKQIKTYKEIFNRQLQEIQNLKVQIKQYFTEKNQFQTENLKLKSQITALEAQMSQQDLQLKTYKFKLNKKNYIDQGIQCDIILPDQSIKTVSHQSSPPSVVLGSTVHMVASGEKISNHETPNQQNPTEVTKPLPIYNESGSFNLPNINELFEQKYHEKFNQVFNNTITQQNNDSQLQNSCQEDQKNISELNDQTQGNQIQSAKQAIQEAEQLLGTEIPTPGK